MVLLFVSCFWDISFRLYIFRRWGYFSFVSECKRLWFWISWEFTGTEVFVYSGFGWVCVFWAGFDVGLFFILWGFRCLFIFILGWRIRGRRCGGRGLVLFLGFFREFLCFLVFSR